MAGIIAANGHLALEVAAPSSERRASGTGAPALALATLDAPMPLSGPIRTPSDCTRWPVGNYAILRGKGVTCPEGFEQVDAYLRAIQQFLPSNGNFDGYIKRAEFGSSNVQCHGRCGDHGENYGELNLSLCVR